jgi:hypothetical protein
VKLFPKYREKEFWVEQGIRLGSWVTIIIIFLLMRDMALAPPYCPEPNISWDMIENASKNITQCICR